MAAILCRRQCVTDLFLPFVSPTHMAALQYKRDGLITDSNHGLRVSGNQLWSRLILK